MWWGSSARDKQIDALVAACKGRVTLNKERSVVEVQALLSAGTIVLQVCLAPDFPTVAPGIRIRPHPQGALIHSTLDVPSQMVSQTHIQWGPSSQLTTVVQRVIQGFSSPPPVFEHGTGVELLVQKDSAETLGLTLTSMTVVKVRSGSPADRYGCSAFLHQRLVKVTHNFWEPAMAQSAGVVQTTQAVGDASTGREIVVLMFEPQQMSSAVAPHGESTVGFFDAPGDVPFPPFGCAARPTHQISAGSKLLVLEEGGEWARVRWGQRLGFVKLGNVRGWSDAAPKAGPQLPPCPVKPDPAVPPVATAPTLFPELDAVDISKLQSLDGGRKEEQKAFALSLEWAKQLDRDEELLKMDIARQESKNQALLRSTQPEEEVVVRARALRRELEDMRSLRSEMEKGMVPGAVHSPTLPERGPEFHRLAAAFLEMSGAEAERALQSLLGYK
eukprot:TRINITY_DN31973_c0_g1_i1.p1 TRINITY_DN31973_c0_g1~~TRINITY_DN31973_c0_g1_i1.p1  ORF type:complete len:444 (+),score=120.67 TRINITY_DN31973_c0_g1_i1:70-1401(+)